jgi:hypothetical protein
MLVILAANPPLALYYVALVHEVEDILIKQPSKELFSGVLLSMVRAA